MVAAKTPTIPAQATGRLARTLRRFFGKLRAEVTASIHADQPIPDLSRWLPHLLQAVTGVLGPLWRQGARSALDLIARLTGQTITIQHGLSRYRFLRQKERQTEPVGIAFDLYNPKIENSIAQALFSFCQSTLDTLATDLETGLVELRGQLVAGTRAGETQMDLTRRVREIFADTVRANRIAVTETSRAVHGGQLIAARETGIVQRQRWLASADACDFCLELDGKEVNLDEPFAVRQEGNPAYRTIWHPPGHPFCWLPGTDVFAPGLIGGYQARYCGPVIRIELATGEKLACTGNHQLMTRLGLIAASRLMRGDYVLYCPLIDFLIDPNNDGQPAVIEQVIRALTITPSVTTTSVPAAAEYLHGDGTFCQSDIDIVRPNGLFKNNRQFQQLSKLPFKFRGADVFFPDNGLPAKLLERLMRSTDSGMSSSNHLPFFFNRHPSQSQQMSFAESSWSNSSVQESASDNCPRNIQTQGDGLFSFTGPVSSDNFFRVDGNSAIPTALLSGPESGTYFRKSLSKSSFAHSNGIGELLKSCPGLVTTRQILNVESCHYNGPVFDLETSSAFYFVGGGAISGNCMCTATLVL